MSRRVLQAALCCVLAGCASASVNYIDPLGPRYFGGTPTDTTTRGSLKVVVMNAHFAAHTDSMVALMRENESLQGADVLLLQEMDEQATRMIADSLGMYYVYYPATVHPLTGRDFGNAVLSRYRLSDDRKVVLPHLARFRNTARAAVGATIHVAGRPVRLYSVHIATVVDNGPGARRAQVEAVLADADSASTVIIGGDFNSPSIAEAALTRGYTWPTRSVGRTKSLWSIDHLLVKGGSDVGAFDAGTVKETRGASDHRPVWVTLSLGTNEDRASHAR